MPAASGIANVVNYLVPATGSTKAYVISQVLSATPVAIDFRQTDIDQEQFRPSGVFIDNTAGTGPVTVLINEMNFNIVCATGKRMQTQYPAPMAQSAQITGLGQASVIFVDFPVIPYQFV